MENKLALSLLLVFLLSLMVNIAAFRSTSFNWFSIPQANEMYLIGYDKGVAGDSASAELYLSGNGACVADACGNETALQLSGGVNRIAINVSQCQRGAEFPVVISCGGDNLSFTSERIESNVGEDRITAAIAAFRKGDAFYLNITFNSTLKNSGYKSFGILLDGETVLQPTYYLKSGNSSSVFVEKIPARPGEHTVELVYNSSILGEAGVGAGQRELPFPELVLFILSILLAFQIKGEYGLDMLCSFLVFFVVLSAGLAFQFQLSRNFGSYEWVLPSLFILGVFGTWISKKRR